MVLAAKPRRLGRGLNALLSSPAAAPVTVNAETGGVPSVGASGDGPASEHTSDLARGSESGAESDAAVGGGGAGGASEGSDGGVLSVRIDDIVPSPFQPRRVFDSAELDQLAGSIRRSGVMQPIIVRRRSDDAVREAGFGGGFGAGRAYELVAGERRWRAAERAGLERLPALVRVLDDETAAEWALVENLQRTDLNAMERARALQGLIDRFGITQGQAAERVGLERSSVANLVRLLELAPPLQDLIETGRLGFGHGKALLAAPEGARLDLAEDCMRDGWSVRRLERAASAAAKAVSDGGGAGLSGGGSGGCSDDGVGVEMRDLEKRLSEHLGTKVSVRPTGDGSRGTLMVSFYSLDHFDDLMGRFGFDGS